LIAATSDQSSAVVWAKTNTNIGATAENIGTGLSNTNLIIANQGNTGTYGAKIARDYTGGGYTDWFLPSAQELHQLYLATNLLGANALGSNAYYLSSTEYSTTNFIYEGTMPDYYKTPGSGAYPAGTTKTNNPLRVRAIRSF
jgi:trimeric autotransporter adhesin